VVFLAFVHLALFLALSVSGTEFRRTLTIFCNQGLKVRERIRLLQCLILNEYAARYVVARH